MDFYRISNGYSLSTSAAASFVRHELATAIRKNPVSVNVLIAGWDEKDGISLHYIDYLGAATTTSKAAHGYAAHFILGLMDRNFKPDLSYEEGLDLAQKCVGVLRKRFLIAQRKFTALVVRADGIEAVDLGLNV
jgi:20S proteasome subunit beta 4